MYLLNTMHPYRNKMLLPSLHLLFHLMTLTHWNYRNKRRSILLLPLLLPVLLPLSLLYLSSMYMRYHSLQLNTNLQSNCTCCRGHFFRIKGICRCGRSYTRLPRFQRSHPQDTTSRNTSSNCQLHQCLQQNNLLGTTHPQYSLTISGLLRTRH